MTLQSHETNLAPPQLDNLVGELRQMIDQARESVASTINTRLGMLYWHLGNRVRKEILKEERAKYGRSIVASVARQLTLDYGKGFSEKSLRRMMQFGEVFPDEQIVVMLLRQLTWTHMMVLLPIKDTLKPRLSIWRKSAGWLKEQSRGCKKKFRRIVCRWERKPVFWRGFLQTALIVFWTTKLATYIG